MSQERSLVIEYFHLNRLVFLFDQIFISKSLGRLDLLVIRILWIQFLFLICQKVLSGIEEYSRSRICGILFVIIIVEFWLSMFFDDSFFKALIIIFMSFNLNHPLEFLLSIKFTWLMNHFRNFRKSA